MSLGAPFDRVEAPVRRVLERALEGREVSIDDAVVLCGARGESLHALVLTADEVRRREVGDVVRYVVNRNVNFTNVCVKACRFCAFSRTRRSEEGYFLPVDEVVRRTGPRPASTPRSTWAWCGRSKRRRRTSTCTRSRPRR
jgi:FO synthase subunit 2